MTAELHHLALGARDVDGLAAFYREVVGLPELKRREDEHGLFSMWLALGGAVLMIERTHAAPRPVAGVGAGVFLLALRATGEQRRALEQRLQAAGSALEERSRYTSYYRDPEGNRLALSDYPL